MNTTPKAKKYRMRKAEPLVEGAQPPAADLLRPEISDDGFGDRVFATAARAGEQDASSRADAKAVAKEIEEIRAEGLTGRQLRMARRVAQRQGIEATSDYEAVRLLRRKGIDPFQRSNVLDLVVAKAANSQPEDDDRVQLPQTVPQKPKLPAKEAMSEERRAKEILRIQRDIARRRQRKLLLLFARLAVFVLLPTAFAGWYFFNVATPLYATQSQFVIQQADAAAPGGLGGLFSGTSFATSQDSITVQSYLESRDAMLRLDEDLGFKAHFSQEFIDPVQRLEPGASNEEAYGIYSRNVKIGYDPTEGIIKMEVIAADPETSAAFSRALIGYAEERVDKLTQRLREDQMKGARESYADAEQKVLSAQERVLELQEQLGVLDPASETGVKMSQVATFEGQLQQKRLELEQLLDNPQPNQARVDGVRGDIDRLERLIAELRATLTQGDEDTTSLAAITGRLRIAEAELETRQLMLSQAAQQLEVARIEANKQVRYLSLGVSPVAPDRPTYPRSLENTALAFAIFAGIYLMMSLTASILREQVSA
ncbi:capsule biosynthesis protein [Ostreiculturibacter nitratireducens]|uniref:capsule biosynthesis protein n=1 Tax=Ostreiculturibacter nitratireducens TaxID=3075226 RepID=UPI0031B5DD97